MPNSATFYEYLFSTHTRNKQGHLLVLLRTKKRELADGSQSDDGLTSCLGGGSDSVGGSELSNNGLGEGVADYTAADNAVADEQDYLDLDTEG